MRQQQTSAAATLSSSWLVEALQQKISLLKSENANSSYYCRWVIARCDDWATVMQETAFAPRGAHNFKPCGYTSTVV
jgi:hypothetical protein